MVAAGALAYIINSNFFPFTKTGLYYGTEKILPAGELAALSKKSIEIGWNMLQPDGNDTHRKDQ